MTLPTRADDLSTSVDKLNISGRRSPEYTMDGEDVVFMPKTLTRDYIASRQPWDSISLPHQYIPDNRLRWFPPLFFLGIVLTTKEVFHFAKSLGLSVTDDSDLDTYSTVAHHLSTICGFEDPNSIYPRHHVTVEECDAEGRPWMVALISNYQILQGFDYSDPYTIILEALEKAFGGSKKIEWWLEHTINHAPKDYMWRKLRPAWVRNWDETYDYSDDSDT